ncbi:MAG TPA: hypothetical protein VHY83_04900 [Solirubrobacteraceae bacterium]|jgi:hypothetical protein|nr:hypothetical protein [Solirubrobacteraceae bacterium]
MPESTLARGEVALAVNARRRQCLAWSSEQNRPADAKAIANTWGDPIPSEFRAEFEAEMAALDYIDAQLATEPAVVQVPHCMAGAVLCDLEEYLYAVLAGGDTVPERLECIENAQAVLPMMAELVKSGARYDTVP